MLKADFFMVAIYFTNPNTSPSDANDILNEVLQAYPDDPAVGSPYSPDGVAASDRFYGSTNQYKVSPLLNLIVIAILNYHLFSASRFHLW